VSGRVRAALRHPAFGLLAAASLAASAGLHAAVMAAYSFRWDKAAAVTTVPLLAWAAAGLALAVVAAPFLRTRLPLLVAGVWLVTALACADESRGLLRAWHERPGTGSAAPFRGQPVLRVVTHNCGSRAVRALAAGHLEQFRPDVVLLQEAPHYAFVRDLCLRLYGPQGTFLYDSDCTVLARGQLARTNRGRAGDHLQAVLTLPGGDQIDLLNVHLLPGVTDLRLWRRDTWVRHYHTRLARRQQLGQAVAGVVSTGGHRPAIVGGDFNAPPPDATFQVLRNHFTDTYQQAGSGWSNTFSNAHPLLRIDQVWVSPGLRAVRHGTFKSPYSDHRIVVVDLVAGT
jgi:endonuclease/exonuclease/phosphatase (EEP) superfamily protein YafD